VAFASESRNVTKAATATLAVTCCGVGGLVLNSLLCGALLALDVSASSALQSSFGLSSFLALIALVFRFCCASETAAFLQLESTGRIPAGLNLAWRYRRALWRALGGTCVCWFFLSFSLASLASTRCQSDSLLAASRTLLVAGLLSVPGCALAAASSHWRRARQLVGFFAACLGFLLLAVAPGVEDLEEVKLAISEFLLLALVAGPAATAILIPGSFPSCVRASCLGISAAAGSLGVIVAVSLRAMPISAIHACCALSCGLGTVGTALLAPRCESTEVL